MEKDNTTKTNDDDEKPTSTPPPTPLRCSSCTYDPRQARCGGGWDADFLVCRRCVHLYYGDADQLIASLRRSQTEPWHIEVITREHSEWNAIVVGPLISMTRVEGGEERKGILKHIAFAVRSTLRDSATTTIITTFVERRALLATAGGRRQLQRAEVSETTATKTSRKRDRCQ